ncbi:hypothetical protein EXIGLDRAFT_844762 [Exidia glandulosa HHB12029]|uniref:F-box domain-containing protein n=1 Tax=Exidia glandulosa HHB12029 TaxID=1314781 RepID=A0A165BUJ3_EXIGL|nr:hypothetical protein EXIGLDRAFT_844762 [Exidia glandulosa HHB12029]
MLTPTHNLAIEACLHDVFRDLTQGVDSASQVQNIFMAVINKALRVLRDGMLEWNSSSTAQRVPPEVLASCLDHLSLADLVRASHVSRHWRSVALAFPALWTDIRLTSAHPRILDLLRSVLPRTGACPVDFAYTRSHTTSSPGPLDDIDLLLCEHMHHMRSIAWPGSIDATCFSQPAPMLETVSCSSVEIAYLPESFLGGVVGRMRSLELAYLDLTLEGFPALSSVTHLVCTLPWNVRGTASLGPLFDLFPNVEYLHLRALKSQHGTPSCSAPPSLRFLSLETQDLDVDIASVLDLCRHEDLRDVTLRARTVHLDLLDSLLSSLNSLSVSMHQHFLEIEGFSDVGLTRSISLDLHMMRDEDIACHVVRLAASLKSLTLPLRAWTCLLSFPNALPVLAKVTLRISQFLEYSCLSQSLPIDNSPLHTPMLRSVVLQLPARAAEWRALEIRACQILGPDSPRDVDATLMVGSEVVPLR